MIGTTLSLHARCPGHPTEVEALGCSDRRLRAALAMLDAARLRPATSSTDDPPVTRVPRCR